jgi:hypothetical protein
MMLTARTQRLLEMTAKGKREGPLQYDDGEGLDTARDWLRLHRASVELEVELGDHCLRESAGVCSNRKMSTFNAVRSDADGAPLVKRWAEVLKRTP